MPIDWGSVGGGAINAGISAGLDAVGGYFSAQSQYRMQKQMYKKRYQWQVQDMMKAGINPMLAFSQGAPVPGSVQAPPYGGIGSRAAEAGVKGFSAALMKKQLDSQLMVNESQVIKNTSEASAARAKAALDQVDVLSKQAGLPFVGPQAEATLSRTQTEIDNIFAQAFKAAKDSEKTELEISQMSEMFPIRKRFELALAKAKEEEIPVRELIAMFAQSMGGNWRTVFGVDYGDLRNDTMNYLEDTWNKFKSGAIDANKAAADILDKIGETVKEGKDSFIKELKTRKSPQHYRKD